MTDRRLRTLERQYEQSSTIENTLALANALRQSRRLFDANWLLLDRLMDLYDERLYRTLQESLLDECVYCSFLSVMRSGRGNEPFRCSRPAHTPVRYYSDRIMFEEAWDPHTPRLELDQLGAPGWSLRLDAYGPILQGDENYARPILYSDFRVAYDVPERIPDSILQIISNLAGDIGQISMPVSHLDPDAIYCPWCITNQVPWLYGLYIFYLLHHRTEAQRHASEDLERTIDYFSQPQHPYGHPIRDIPMAAVSYLAMCDRKNIEPEAVEPNE